MTAGVEYTVVRFLEQMIKVRNPGEQPPAGAGCRALVSACMCTKQTGERRGVQWPAALMHIAYTSALLPRPLPLVQASSLPTPNSLVSTVASSSSMACESVWHSP